MWDLDGSCGTCDPYVAFRNSLADAFYFLMKLQARAGVSCKPYELIR